LHCEQGDERDVEFVEELDHLGEGFDLGFEQLDYQIVVEGLSEVTFVDGHSGFYIVDV